MSGFIKSAMGFEVSMDDDFEGEIYNVLGLVERNAPGVARCKLRKVAEKNSWIIECLWCDQQAMHAHFQSSQLQELIRLLASRSRKIVFDCNNY